MGFQILQDIDQHLDNAKDEHDRQVRGSSIYSHEGRFQHYRLTGPSDSFQSGTRPLFDDDEVIRQSRFNIHVPLSNFRTREQIVELLLDKGANVNVVGDLCPLLIASKICSKRVIQALLRAGADVNIRATSQTPLELTCGRKSSGGPTVSQLLHAGASIPCPDGCKINPFLNTALDAFIESCGGQNEEQVYLSDSVYQLFSNSPARIIEILLRKLPHEKAKDKRYSLVLQMAAATGNMPHVQLLLGHQADVNIVGYDYGTALHAASRLGRVEVVGCLLRAGARVNALGGEFETPLRAAVIEGSLETVECLLKHGASVDLRAKPWSPPAFYIAVENNMSDIVRMLLAAGCSLKSVSVSLLHRTVGLISRVIGDLGIDLPEDALHIACRIGDPLVVEHMILARRKKSLLHGLRLTGRGIMDKVVFEALCVACKSGRQDVVQVLLGFGTLRENRASGQKNPLQIAAANGFHDIVQQLLRGGAKANLNTGQTALSIGAEAGRLEVVRVLVENAATIYKPGRIPNALRHACPRDHVEIFSFLLENFNNTEERDQAVA